jgi:hypothetical protein
VIEAMTAATWRSKVALSINLTGGVFVNQSALSPTTTAPAATRRPTPRMPIPPSSPTASASFSAATTFEDLP